MRKGRMQLLKLFVLIFAMSSCDKLLDIKPDNVRVEGEAIRTEADLQFLLNSVYDALRSDYFMGGNDWVAAELLADNLNANSVTGNLQAIYNRNTTIFNSVSRQLWDQAYTCIYRCNLVLKYVQTVNGLKPEVKAKIMGEAHFLRAFCHFELVRFFAQPYGFSPGNGHLGIPIRIVPGILPIARNTVNDVYTQVISDFNFAILELPSDYSSGRPNLWAAKAMLARVYFQENDFFFALKYAKDAVENSSAIFQPDFTKRFSNATNTDNLFELLSNGSGTTGQQSGALLGSLYTSTINKPTLTYTKDFYNELKRDAGEKRLGDWSKLVPANGSNPEDYYPTKLNYSVRFNIPVIQLVEMKLIYAESALEEGDPTTAKIQLNDVRLRAGLSKYTTSNTALLFDEIRHQRRLEMVLEGNRVHDLKRQAIRAGGGAFLIRNAAWNCPGLVLAIPDDEMSANAKMVQNILGGCN